MTTTTPAPAAGPYTAGTTVESVRSAVDALVPVLRANAERTEAERRVPDDNIEALRAAGVFKLSLPRQHGGLEASLADQIEVTAQIARGCPSTSWVTTISLAVSWMVGVFPDQGRQEVYETPDLCMAGVFAPTAKGERVSGGVVVSGRWGWNTGSPNAHWAGMAALVKERDGSVSPQFLLIPYSELTVLDDWYSSGLAGTGSNTTVADNVFVPDHRIRSVLDLATANYPDSSLAATNSYFAKPGVPVFIAGSTGTPQGIARGATDVFLERLPGRKITYTEYEEQAQAPITHHQVAEAHLKTTSLDAHVAKTASLIDDCDGELTVEARAGVRGHTGHVTRLAREIVEILFQASGASAIQTSVPIQRYHRDIQSLALHALMQPNTNSELLGRVLLGLSPDTTFL
ncbi:MAG TPA: acyl-CoA dehydrogenase family protein [Amycolatopsis sp.]|nr:acyl-CoA dehydrogenase family protein [Amycolatopsis sp.]